MTGNKKPALRSTDHAPVATRKKRNLRGLGYFPGFDTTRANLHAMSATLWFLNADGLQVRIKSPRRSIVRVGYVIPELRTFAADFATFSHDIDNASRTFYCRESIGSNERQIWNAIYNKRFCQSSSGRSWAKLGNLLKE